MNKLKIHLIFMIPTVLTYALIKYLLDADTAIIVGICNVLAAIQTSEYYKK